MNVPRDESSLIVVSDASEWASRLRNCANASGVCTLELEPRCGQAQCYLQRVHVHHAVNFNRYHAK